MYNILQPTVEKPKCGKNPVLLQQNIIKAALIIRK
jgi:hypothetical protein